MFLLWSSRLRPQKTARQNALRALPSAEKNESNDFRRVAPDLTTATKSPLKNENN